MDLSEQQGAAVAVLDEMIETVGQAFDRFVQAADECEALQVPQEILNGKAVELQQAIMSRMARAAGAAL